MTFVHPIAGLIAAGIAIPLLVLLYVLKLRRQAQPMASTFLWKRAVDDLEVNAPFQRLRSTPLLWLQLLLLAVLLLAIAQPRLKQERDPAGRVLLLIDVSASMQTLLDDGERTRFDEAIEIAEGMIAQINRGGTSQQAMIVSFASVPRVVSTYQSDRRTLLDALKTISPSVSEADLDAALQLAGAFSAPGEDVDAQPPDVVLISDGSLRPPEDGSGHQLRHGRFEYVQVGSEASRPADNLGIVGFSARRSYEDPGTVAVAARLLNAASTPVETVLLLNIEGQAGITIPITVPPGTADGPGTAGVTRAIEMPGGGVLTLRHAVADALPLDDTAALIMPAPAPIRVMLVHGTEAPDQDLMDLVNALQPGNLDVRTSDGFLAIDPGELDAGEIADLVIFDRVDDVRLPGVASLTFGAVPAGLTAKPPKRDGGQPILSWDRQHPLLRHVSLDTVVFAGFGSIDVPANADVLARGADGPAIVVVPTRGARHVIVGFELGKSTWPLNVGFAVFCGNAMEYLTLAESGLRGRVVRPGEVITVRAARDVNRLIVDGPASAEIPVATNEPIGLPRFDQLGVYTVKGALPPDDRLAVSLLSDVESDIRVRDSIRVNARSATASAGDSVTPRELWPWLAAGAMVLLVLEWLLYCRKVR